MKKIIAILLCAVMLSMSLLLSSCGESKDDGNKDNGKDDADTTVVVSGETEYNVTVKDYLGTPFTTGIIVTFFKGDEQVAMQAVDAEGVAKKTLPADDYSVKLSFTAGDDAFYYESTPTLSAAAPAAEVVLASKVTADTTVIMTNDKEYNVHSVEVGCTYVELESGVRNYFLFTPTQGGHYEFSVGDGADVVIGSYGSPHYIQENSNCEVVDGKFAIDVKDGMVSQGEGGTAVYVIGVDSTDAKSCVIAVDRTGDATKTIEDEPWTNYVAVHTPELYTLPEGSVINEFDLTASTDTYTFVLDEATGYYHLNSVDGPLVLVRLAQDCDYIACYETISSKQGIVKYFYDGEPVYENFIKKENYTDCIYMYLDFVDESEGVYPLTEDLMYIIQQNGDHLGWWDTEGSSYLFKNLDGSKDLTINTEIAWLLMCCYID